MTLKNKYSIAEGIKKLAGNKRQTELLLAEVRSVNKSQGKIVIDCPWLGLQNETIDYHAAQIGGKKFVLWPAVGSMIVVGRLEATDQLFVVAVISPETVELRGGEWSMVKGETMKQEVEKLKASVDLILNAINNGVPAAGSADGGTALQTSMKTIVATANSGNFSQILNQEVKHG